MGNVVSYSVLAEALADPPPTSVVAYAVRTEVLVIGITGYDPRQITVSNVAVQRASRW